MNFTVRAAIILLGSAGPAAGAELTGYEALANWNDLPRAKTGIVAGLASSYDRTDGNDDFNYYESPEGHQTTELDTVVVTLPGPGVITRFQMPHAAANAAFPVKITVDGVLRIDTDSDALLGGSYGYMTGPLVQTLIGGQVSYEPIGFQHSLTIESRNYASGGWARTHHYYQYNYQLFSPGQTITPYTGTLTPAQQSGRAAAVDIIDNAGANPAGADATAVVLSQPAQSVPAGGSLTLAGISGSGRIRRLNLKMDAAGDAELDGLSLRVRYDGRAEYALDVPVAHFFGAGHERAAYRSLPLGTDGEDGFYCYWPMPFRRQVSVELYNSTGDAISIDSAAVEYTIGGVSDQDAYLHAQFRQDTLQPDDPYWYLLQADGAGHYVGHLLYIQRTGTSRYYLEGDDDILVDGSQWLYGTGVEDAHNGGYYYNHVLEQSDDGDVPDPESGTGPFHGLLHMDDADFGDNFVRADQYRWRIADAVPFTESIQMRLEHYASGMEALFGSTAFYYLLPDPPIPGDANFDGCVDGLDYDRWSLHYQMPGAWSEGDYNADAVADGLDYNVWSLNYQAGCQAASAGVPEPAALGLLAAGAAFLLSRRRRQA